MEPNPAMEGTWDIQAPLPVPTQELAVPPAPARCTSSAGSSGRTTDTNDVWVYDPGTKIWSAAAPYPGKSVDHPGRPAWTARST